ncbi:hypothetical protein [Rhodanobacter koreensis]
MNAGPLFTVASLPRSGVGFAMSAGLRRGHDFDIGHAAFIKRGSTGGHLFCGIGCQDGYLRCINIKVWGGLAWNAMACVAWVFGCLDGLLLCGKHSLQEHFIIQQ